MIYLVRHGETAWNLIGRRQGRLDSPLTDRGVAQAQAVGRRLRELIEFPGEKPTRSHNKAENCRLHKPITHDGSVGLFPTGDSVARRIVSSPLGRAMATASIIAGHLDIDRGLIIAEPLLAEHHMGQWQGLTSAQIDEQFPGARQERKKNKWEYVIPGGESYATVYTRAMAWLATVPEDQVLITVTHEMIGRTIRGAYCELDPHSMLALNHPHHVVYRLHGGEAKEIACDQTSVA
jgi:broad specificity phosphatase PhoE